MTDLSFQKKSLKKKTLPIFISAGLLSGVFLAGCSNSDSNSSSNTLSVNVNSDVTASMSASNTSVLEAEVTTAGSQASNAALFTLGADASTVLATILSIDYPSVSGVTFTQVIPNGSDDRDCTAGLTFSNDLPNCILKVDISGSAGVNIDDEIQIVTDVQTLSISVVTQIVNEGSAALPQGQINTTPTVAPDTKVQVKVTNPSTNTQSFNNLTLTIPAWLYNLGTNFQGGTVSTNTNGSKTITYTVSGLSQNLAPGATHTFSFNIDGESTTTDTLLAHYDELVDNANTGVLTIDAANLRNPLKPALTVSVTPATITESVTLEAVDSPQTVTFTNLSSSRLQITEIDSSGLPAGVSIDSTTCSIIDGEYIEPADDADDSCDIILEVAADTAAGEGELTLSYNDLQGNDFQAETTVNTDVIPPATDCNAVDLECRVFVTSSTGNGDFSSWDNAGAATSIGAANNICAGDDNNPGGNFKAWISTSDTNAVDNINYNIGITYVRAADTGTVIADPGELINTYVSDLTNTVSAAETKPFTGTAANGELQDAARTCNDWVLGDNTYGVTYGYTRFDDSSWTYNGYSRSCSVESTIMCFESLPE